MDEDHGKLNFFETSSALSELFGADFETFAVAQTSASSERAELMALI